MKQIQMARESFLLRTDPKILSLLRRWAEDDLRSTNGQLDFILRKALRDAGRLPSKEKNSKKKKEPTDD
jgi:hypothetical protein